MYRWAVLLAVVVLAAALSSAPARAGTQAALVVKADLVVVIKSERRLYLIKNGWAFRSYDIALGRRPEGPKVQAGDGRTPEGTYLIDGRNARSHFHRSLHISYPGPGDLVRARALGVSPGGAIAIHGLPEGWTATDLAHPRLDWTQGCIAVTNAEIHEIWEAVDDGTPIEIWP